MALLEITGLRVAFPLRRGEVVAAHDISLSIEPGEVLGVVGESGAGKSTIGAALMDLLEPPGRVTAGEVRLNGRRLPLGDAQAMRAVRGRHIGMVFQDPLTALDPLFSVGDQLIETLRRHRPELSQTRARAAALELLEAVGVADAKARADDYPHQFSGGMRQRVVIALALAGDPELLVADEPTTALDVSLQARILNLLRRQAAERGIGILLITHDMGVVSETADRVQIMRRGEIVEAGPTREIFQSPQHPYTQALLGAVPPVERRLNRFPVPTVAGEADVEAANAERRARLLKQWPHTGGGGTLLEVSGLSKTFGRRWFEPGHRVVKDVNFSIAAGESLGLVGESGSGKTTIARLIAGLEVPDAGQIVFAGREQGGAAGGAARRGIQMIFQDPYSSLNPRLRVGFTIAEPLRMREPDLPANQVAERVGDLLALVGLPAGAADQWPHEFSGGQRQRIAIARALGTAPRLLICDEPTSALDVSIQAQILNLLKDLQEELDLAMLFISHDLPVVLQMCGRIGVLKDGVLVELRETDALFDNPQDAYTAELLRLAPRVDRVLSVGQSGA